MIICNGGYELLYKETVKAADKESKSSMLMAFVIVLSIVVVVGFCNFLYNRFGISYTSYIAFILSIIIGIYVYRNKIREYRYSIIDDELIFEQIVGTKIKPITSVKLSRVLYFCPLEDEIKDKNKKWDQKYSLFFKKRASKIYVLAAKQGKKDIRIIFQPSDEMVKLIERAKK